MHQARRAVRRFGSRTKDELSCILPATACEADVDMDESFNLREGAGGRGGELYSISWMAVVV